MKCKNCKYWGKGDEQDWLSLCEYDGMNVKFCSHRMVGNGYKADSISLDGVAMFDEGGVTGELTTNENFGCIHFENGKVNHGE